MKTTFNYFDIVKLKDNIEIPELSGKNIYGIVYECNDTYLYATWFSRATATKTRIINYTKWIKTSDVELVGDICSLVIGATSKTTKVKVRVVKEITDNSSKVTKPTPTKETKVANKQKEVVETDTKVTYVPRPTINKGWKQEAARQLSSDSLKRKHYYTIATGKFKYFTNRKDIIESVNQNGAHYYNKLDWNLDLAIVGEKPGPNKIEFFKKLNIPVISEEQWLAYIGHPYFKFEDERPTSDAA